MVEEIEMSQYIEIAEGKLKGARGYLYNFKSKRCIRLYLNGREIIKEYEGEKYLQTPKAISEE